MTIESRAITSENSSQKRYKDSEIESLLLERLNGDSDIEFDIEDVRSELAERIKRHKTDDKCQPNT